MRAPTVDRHATFYSKTVPGWVTPSLTFQVTLTHIKATNQERKKKKTGEISARPFSTDNHFKKTCQSNTRRDVTSGGLVAEIPPSKKKKKKINVNVHGVILLWSLGPSKKKKKKMKYSFSVRVNIREVERGTWTPACVLNLFIFLSRIYFILAWSTLKKKKKKSMNYSNGI